MTEPATEDVGLALAIPKPDKPAECRGASSSSVPEKDVVQDALPVAWALSVQQTGTTMFVVSFSEVLGVYYMRHAF